MWMKIYKRFQGLGNGKVLERVNSVVLVRSIRDIYHENRHGVQTEQIRVWANMIQIKDESSGSMSPAKRINLCINQLDK